MARDESLPFARGETFYNGGSIDTTDTTQGASCSLGGLNLEGKEYVTEENAQSQGTGYPVGLSPVGRPIRVKVVRNASGAALLPKRIVTYQCTTSIKPGTRVDSYALNNASNNLAGVVDEYLPATGVPANDLFYIVVKGPTTLISATTSGPLTITPGARLIADTCGATATDPAGGRVGIVTVTATTAETYNSVLHQFGCAASTAAVSNASIDAVVEFRF